jgi:hypothetical protein
MFTFVFYSDTKKSFASPNILSSGSMIWQISFCFTYIHDYFQLYQCGLIAWMWEGIFLNVTIAFKFEEDFKENNVLGLTL